MKNFRLSFLQTLVRKNSTRCLPNFCYFLLLSYLIPCTVHAGAIKSLEAFIADSHAVYATFSQTLLDKNARPIQRIDGTMQFERPGKFKWVYKKPYEQVIIGDGAKIWFYDNDLNQVTVRKFDSTIDSSPAGLLASNKAIEDHFHLSEVGLQGGLEWLAAEPKKKEGSFELVRLGFTKAGLLKIMELKDNFGQTTILTFSNLERNPKFSSELFKFIPPKGVDIISD
ncbi:MAG: outer membrane lipoprotein chaperone LolA [Nitrosospira sp.]|nr:outer membrane lipoprotein chaperone LolA [Nitrosospira sp.]MBI0416661.1 outer membrane lipoprotein chaperone LolA [Nitrosospira sp.]MBI0418135.1 outer membrane lipoprotein chaperone LolA [Nitrosospira sp.]MBI0419414.1 outer membrane lipoprotein chaperone LolA [Nitrosospira sp.]